MHVYRRCLKSNSGYTFVESIFQLVILGIFLHLLVLFFIWKGSIETNYPDRASTEWELFAIEMQQLLANVDQLEILSGGTVLRCQNDRGRIDISRSNTVIRKQVDGQGHVPLLTNIRSIQFAHSGDYIVIAATTLDGKLVERNFAVGLYPK